MMALHFALHSLIDAQTAPKTDQVTMTDLLMAVYLAIHSLIETQKA